jgi:hypothetical protein
MEMLVLLDERQFAGGEDQRRRMVAGEGLSGLAERGTACFALARFGGAERVLDGEDVAMALGLQAVDQVDQPQVGGARDGQFSGRPPGQVKEIVRHIAHLPLSCQPPQASTTAELNPCMHNSGQRRTGKEKAQEE